MKPQKPIIICGPTASGKTALALQLAQELTKRNGIGSTAIINADSQQVYKEIPILSAQPSEQEKQVVPYFLFGQIAGSENFNVAIWLKKANAAIGKIEIPIIVGGTGMYLNALLHGLAMIPDIPDEIRNKVREMSKDQLIEELGDKADGNTSRMRRRLEVKLATGREIEEFHTEQNPVSTGFRILNMNVSRETIYQNINKRFADMVENGAVEEVRKLLGYNYNLVSPVMKAVGIAELSAYIKGDCSLPQATEKAQQRSRNYAKRQMTWFRHQLPEDKNDVASFDEVITLFP